jgi:hypothetical protein
MAGGIRPRRRGLVVLSSGAGLLAVGWLATEPWLADHWPRLLVAVLFLLVLPVPRWSTPGRGDEDRPQLHHDGRIGLVQALAGVAVIASRGPTCAVPACAGAG